MKLIITGASGYVGTELVRQSLKHPAISSVIAVARKSLSPPTDVGVDYEPTKFQSVKIDDYGVYSDEVKAKLAGADACIWTVAVTPLKSKRYSHQDLRKIIYDNTQVGIKAIFEASKSRTSKKPYQFVYMSGNGISRDPTQAPKLMGQYFLLRGETESAVLRFAAEQNGQMVATAAQPGLIIRPGNPIIYGFAGVVSLMTGVPSIYLNEVSVAMIDQTVNGIEKDPLLNEDLVRIGRKALSTK